MKPCNGCTGPCEYLDLAMSLMTFYDKLIEGGALRSEHLANALRWLALDPDDQMCVNSVSVVLTRAAESELLAPDELYELRMHAGFSPDDDVPMHARPIRRSDADVLAEDDGLQEWDEPPDMDFTPPPFDDSAREDALNRQMVDMLNWHGKQFKLHVQHNGDGQYEVSTPMGIVVCGHISEAMELVTVVTNVPTLLPLYMAGTTRNRPPAPDDDIPF